nr:hypothetical protein [Desulfosporosinus orientis]
MRTFLPSSSDVKGFAEALENEAEIIFMADDDRFIAAPGLPLGIPIEELDQIQPRLIHDPLQLGVATMIYEILKGITEKG